MEENGLSLQYWTDSPFSSITNAIVIGWLHWTPLEKWGKARFFKILLVFRPRAGGEPRVNKHIWPSEESGLLDGRYIVYAGREGKNCSKNSFILTNRILQSTLWRTYSVQVKTQNAFVSYRITSPYFGLVFGDIWSDLIQTAYFCVFLYFCAFAHLLNSHFDRHLPHEKGRSACFTTCQCNGARHTSLLGLVQMSCSTSDSETERIRKIRAKNTILLKMFEIRQKRGKQKS